MPGSHWNEEPLFANEHIKKPKCDGLELAN